MGQSQLLVGALLVGLSLGQRHFFHNFPDNSNFTAERLQYGIEREVLKEFYYSTNPSLRDGQARNQPLRQASQHQAENAASGSSKRDWISADRWLSGDVSHCMWEGVQCNANGSVLALFLPDNNLAGTLTPRLLELPHLKQIWAFNNNLGPTLPSWIGNLSKLEVLLLQNNRYEGYLTGWLANLKHLRVLDLSGNNFGENTVKITKPLVRKSWEVKYVREDSGFPPAWTNPQNYSLNGFQSLEDLDLSYNVMHGTIPANLSTITSLKRLWLASNRFRGTVPAELSRLTSLTNLSVELNLPMCSNTTAPQPPEHIQIIPGITGANTCPFSQGPPNLDIDDASNIPGSPSSWDSPNNHRHPLDKGFENWTYCGPHATPAPERCEEARLIPAEVRSLPNLTVTWTYPPQGTLAVSGDSSNAGYDVTQQNRHHRREHRDALYPYQYLIPASELASESGLSGTVNMWNDKQWPYG